MSTQIQVSPKSGITIGTTPITSGVAGRVLFEGAGNVVQEDSAFVWDNTNKRLGVGATPATTVRLDVRAQGALSTDIAFRVRNSADSLSLFQQAGDGSFIFRNNANSAFWNALVGGGMQFFGGGQTCTLTTGAFASIANTGSAISLKSNTHNALLYASGNFQIEDNAILQTSGQGGISLKTGTNPSVSTVDRINIYSADRGGTAGKASFHVLAEDGTINVLGDLSGIGTATPQARLDVKAQGALSTDIAFRVRNSADTANIFEVRGDGNIALFQPGLYAANMKIFGSGGSTIAQFQSEGFGSIALGSEATFDALTYGNVALGQRASTSGGGNSIAIGLNSRAANVANISIGPNSVCIAQYGIKIGQGQGPSGFGGLNSIHLGRTTSGNNIEPDNVFMTYFNSQSSSTLTRSNGSFGLLGQQAYILINGTGTYGLDRFMGDGGNTFVVRNHASIPSTNVADSFQQYSADITAGNAAPHFRTENGSVIKLYKQDLPTSPTNAELATFLSNLGLANLI